MIITIKKGVSVNIRATRDLLNKKHYRFRVFKNKPQKFMVTLMPDWQNYYSNMYEALMHLEFVINTKNTQKPRKIQVITNLQEKM